MTRWLHLDKSNGNFTRRPAQLKHTPLRIQLLTPWSRVLLDRLTGFQLAKKFPLFMEPEGSLPHSQGPATCPYPELARSSPYPYNPLP